MMRGACAIGLVVLLATPLATAQQVDHLDIAFEGGDYELQPGTATTVPVVVEASCDLILAAGGSLSVDIGHNLPTTWTVSTPSISLSADQGCITNSGVQNGTGDLSVTPSSDAPGLVGYDLTLNATAGETTAQSDDAGMFYVAYEPGHSISPTISFPYAMTNDDDGVVSFNLTVTVDANADTLVSFQNLQTGGGSLTGLDSQTFTLAEDETSRTIPVSWTPPADWDNATISFMHFSHCLEDGFTCDPANQQNVTWVITNEQSSGGSKDSPAPAPVFLLGAVAVAMWLRRRG